MIRELKKKKPNFTFGQIQVALRLTHIRNSTIWRVVNKPESYINERTGYFKLSTKERHWIRLMMKGYRRNTKERAEEIKRIAKGYNVSYQCIYKLLRKIP